MNRGKATKLYFTFVALIISIGTFGFSNDAKCQTRSSSQKVSSTSSVPRGTELTLRLKNTIDSKKAQNGDPFSASVVGPDRYEGATVYGHISRVKQSGRVKGSTELSLAFDRIRFANGGVRQMNAEVVEVVGEKSAKVDDEGNIESGGKGSTTAKRTGILGGAGAVIGAIAGGGKGAAIGAVTGAGVGAGSSVIQGSKKLKLDSGTEIRVRVTR